MNTLNMEGKLDDRALPMLHTTLAAVSRQVMPSRDGHPRIERSSRARESHPAGHERMEPRLRQAQRLEALGGLAGDIAHDFNNLLCAIRGYGELARGSVRAGSRLRRDIENIMIAAERGCALVERILAFSQSGVGERAPVHMAAVVHGALYQIAA